MKGGISMLDDLRQEKQEQPFDQLSEGTSLPFSKKVALLCLAVALIGLFIFFTSDSWSSSEGKHAKHLKRQDIAKELEEIKARLTDLEMKSHPQVAALTTNEPTENPTPAKELNDGATGSINLQALIEQELQESNTHATSKEEDKSIADQEEPTTTKKKAQETAKKPQTYTVVKGDSLSKISQKVYGSTKYWKRIVDANKDKLGRSQTLRPGMVLVIPKEGDK